MPYQKIETSSCAVGAVVNHHNNSPKTNIELVLETLAKLPHRGGQIFKKHEGETVKVGDGAGVRCSIDWKFYDEKIAEFGIEKDPKKPHAIGNFFMPVNDEMRSISSLSIKNICEEKGIRILQNSEGNSWRDIPFESDDSETAKELKLQKFQQCFFAPQEEMSQDDFEKALLEIHREIEKYSTKFDVDIKAQGKAPAKLAVASISDKEVIYKGMLLPDEVAHFKDLQESNPAEVFYHIRQSTNVSPTPGNAQPFSHIAHNGEFNSIDGNVYKAHKPSRGFSDSRSFDDHVRDLLLEGHDIREILTMLMPPPTTGDAEIDAMVSDMKVRGFEYNGPAHIVFSHNGVRGAVLDSNALRPSRYLVTKDAAGNLGLYIGSEDMLSEKDLSEMGLEALERGMLRAGEMIVMEGDVIKKHHQILTELKDKYQPTKFKIEEIDLNPPATIPSKENFGEEELEVRKYQLLPLLDGHQLKIAMGDDTPPLKPKGKGVRKAADLFKQKFSQVSSPPIDSRAEVDSFDSITYVGNKNQVDANLIKLESPLLKLGQFEKIAENPQSFSLDLTVDVTQVGDSEGDLLEAMQNLLRQACFDAEAQVRSGKSIIVLDFSRISSQKIALPDVLVTAAIYSHLHKNGLEKSASIVVNSTQMDSAHHFSTLSALGATAVNPALAYNFAIDVANGDVAKYAEKCDNFHKAINEAHKITMAKYGITSADVYHGSRLIESITLNLEEKSADGSYDPSVLSNAFNNVAYDKGFNGKIGVRDLLDDAAINHQVAYGEHLFTSGRYAYKADGIAHSYNPTVVRAVRDATTEYRTRRVLREEYLQKSQILQTELDNFGDNFTQRQAENMEVGEYLQETSKQLNLNLSRLTNENEKLLNSFFLEGIVRELEKITTAQKSSDMEDLGASKAKGRFSLNEISLRQFLLVVEDGRESMTESFSKFKRGEISADEIENILLSKAGFDPSQKPKIKQWQSLEKSGRTSEAAALFLSLNETNQNRIEEIYKKFEENKTEISRLEKLKLETKKAQSENQLLYSVLVKSDDASYKANLAAAIESFTEKAQKNDLLPKITDGKFDEIEMDERKVDKIFRNSMAEVIADKKTSPVSIADHLSLKEESFQPLDEDQIKDLQPVSNIAANVFVTGGMSYGALTLPAHKDVAESAQLIGGKACTGEGGKPEGEVAKVVQVASGRFGLNPEYFKNADEIELKIVQGAKAGQGGVLSGAKVEVEVAAERQSTVKESLTSPPSHHDIYSIEDLQQLIHDLKELKPGVKVVVKICASTGIGEIAKGLAKSGCDIINIAGGSGGTGAAEIDSIKNTGLPSEIGLAIANQALIEAGIRDLVKLQVSGFPFTPEGVIMASILGADVFESGTFDLMLLGCDMHRKCNIPGACGPGITNNAEGYQGHAQDLALYKLNMARAVQDLMAQIGVKNLRELRGRTDLLSPELLNGKVSDEFIASLMNGNQHPELQVGDELLKQYRNTANKGTNNSSYENIYEQGFIDALMNGEEKTFDGGELDVTNRTYGATLAFEHYKELGTAKKDRIAINTTGNAGQSYGAFNVNGMCLVHTGSVQDGFGKSMSGGVLVVKQPENEAGLTDSIYVGNAALYGASGGSAFLPSAGSRFAILMKGTTAVVNGNVGDRACSYMTSGSVLILGKVGKSFGGAMIGGISVIYDNENLAENSDIRFAQGPEAEEYYDAIKLLLEEDFIRTNSSKARAILENFENEKSKFKIVIPRALDKINSLEKLEQNERAFALRYSSRKFGAENSISPFEKCWFRAKRKELDQQKASFQEAPHLTENQAKAQEISNNLFEALQNHKGKMDRYGPLATRIIGGLGMPDQILSDNVSELMTELFDCSKKCSCDSVTCTKSEGVKEDKHTSSGCPLGKNPNLINAILNDKSLSEEQRARKAFEMQIKESPFAGFTGAACPAPCQDSCTHSASDEGNSEAVQIKRIELLLHRIALKNHWYDELATFSPKTETLKGKKVMIVGSGPAALEAAYHLALNGAEVEIFEKNNEIGGLLRYGIPDHKLQKETIDFYKTSLEKMGVKFFTNREIDITKIDPQSDEYGKYDLYVDARGITGNPIPFDPNFTKTDNEKGHFIAMDFLTYCNEFHQSSLLGNSIPHPFEKFNLGKEVLVIGSGDTAEDVKRSILKLNATLLGDEKVNLITVSRQPELSETAATGSNYPHPREVASADLESEISHEANANLTQQHFETSPQNFTTNDQGQIIGVKVDKTYVAEEGFSKDYRTKVQILDRQIIPCSSAIIAIGYKAPQINPKTVSSYASIANQTIVRIGDVATKTGFAPGAELIVNAQATAKGVVASYLGAQRTPNPNYSMPRAREGRRPFVPISYDDTSASAQGAGKSS